MYVRMYVYRFRNSLAERRGEQYTKHHAVDPPDVVRLMAGCGDNKGWQKIQQS